VEDDNDVRAYTVEIIRELGYHVLEAHDGPAALRLLKREDQRSTSCSPTW
jgi:CheY-like chemotaxis protein